MSIVSHIDDDLLFQNPDIQNSIDAGGGHTTVYLVSWDGNIGQSYAEGREAGAKAAYSEMTGETEWVDTISTFSDGETSFDIHTSYLENMPEVRLYFLRLPDGGHGDGFASNNYQSLAQLNDGDLDELTSVDGVNTFNADQLDGLLLGLLEHHQPETVLMQDHTSEYAAGSHSDHVNTAEIVAGVLPHYETEHDVISYIDYATVNFTPNVSAEDGQSNYDAFSAYAAHDQHVRDGFDANGDPILTGSWNDWNYVHYHAHEGEDIAAQWSSNFGSETGGWNNSQHIRDLADVNGDGLADLVGFGAGHVQVGLSAETHFEGSTLAFHGYTQDQGGWEVTQHDRELADINGDGLDDIVGFGYAGAQIALSNGQSFDATQIWSYDFGSADGWTASRHERELGDINGDGMADIVAFGENGVSFALSTGSGFGETQTSISDFGYEQGWRVDHHERVLADVNGDGMDDIVGFGDGAVLTALSNGSGFDAPSAWTTLFTSQGGWNESIHERHVADVNGDGMADIIGFGEDGVYVAQSTGSGFAAAELWTDEMSNSHGWSQENDVRTVADVNGDGMADLVGYNATGVSVALSTGTGFDLTAGAVAEQDFSTLNFVSEENPPTDPGPTNPVDPAGGATIVYELAGPDAGHFIIDPETGELSNQSWFTPSYDQIWDTNGDHIYEATVIGRNETGAEVSREDLELVVTEAETFWRTPDATDTGGTTSPTDPDPGTDTGTGPDTGTDTGTGTGEGTSPTAPGPDGGPQPGIQYELAGPDAGHFIIDPETGTLSNHSWFTPSYDQVWDTNGDHIYETSVIGRDETGAEVSRDDLQLIVTETEVFWQTASPDPDAAAAEIMELLFTLDEEDLPPPPEEAPVEEELFV